MDCDNCGDGTEYGHKKFGYFLCSECWLEENPEIVKRGDEPVLCPECGSETAYKFKNEDLWLCPVCLESFPVALRARRHKNPVYCSNCGVEEAEWVDPNRLECRGCSETIEGGLSG